MKSKMAMSGVKRLGILGGMSWVSSLKYYEIINLEIIKLTEGRRTADLVLWNFDTTEIEPLIAEGKWKSIGELLQNATNKLINCDVAAILIASNTIHRVVEQKLINVPVPFIHIRDALLRELQRRRINRVAFIGTSATMKGGVYRNLIKGTAGIDVLLPPEEFWRDIDDIIFNRLCRGSIEKGDKEFIARILEKLQTQAGIGCVVLGCTELGLLGLEMPGVEVFDTTEIHARDAARGRGGRDQL